MATTIQIKRSANVAAPVVGDLLVGELAYSQDVSNSGAGAKLYIESLDSGSNPVIQAIGGKYYTDLLDAATNTSTGSAIVKRDASGNFNGNVITATTFVGNISGAVTSAVIAATANALTTARDIGLAGDLTGNVSFNGSQNVTLTATIAANSVALGTDTTGNYLANVIPGTGLTGTGFGTEGATPTLTLATSGVTANTYGSTTVVPVITIDTYGRVTNAANATIAHGVNIYGNSGVIAIATNGTGSLELIGGAGITTNASGTKVEFDLRTSGVSATTYGGTTQIPVLTVDTYGRITSASNVTLTSGVSSVNGRSGAVTGLAETANSLSQFASTTSSQLATLISDETGSGALVFGTSPVLTTPNIGTPSYAVLTSATGLPVSTGISGLGTGIATFLATPSSSNLAAAITNESGSNVIVFSDSPTLFTPTLVTPVLGLATGTSVMLSANIGAAAGNVSGNFTAGNFQSAGNVNVAAGLVTGSLTAGTLQTSGNVNANNLRVVTNSSLGTVVSGTWNGGSISTTYTDAKVTSITGTANQVAASSSTGAITLSLPNDVIIPNNLTVTGDLIVQGTAVTMNTATVVVEDPLVKFGNANPSDTFSIGFYGQYTSGGTKYTGLYRDTSDGKFRLFDALATDPTTNSISAAGVTIATLVANLSGGTVTGLTANITVGNGGTGVGTFTTNGILYGNATGSLKVTSAGTDGQVLQVNASGVPIFAGLDGGTY